MWLWLLWVGCMWGPADHVVVVPTEADCRALKDTENSSTCREVDVETTSIELGNDCDGYGH